jgi:hypothetical protein
MKLRINVTFYLLFLACSYTYGQMGNYDYIRQLERNTDQWHKIVLPDEIFGKLTQNLSDIRIFGITANNDTIEAPYLMYLTKERTSEKEVVFRPINASNNDKGYYFTYEIPTPEPINQINLEFSQQNFDWRLKLEGSHNQNEWFTIAENYRILSIKNESTDFKFSKLTFATSKYRFFRILIATDEKPLLIKTAISRQEIAEGVFKTYQIRKSNINENRQTKQTEIDIELPLAVPVSYISIGVNNNIDYYRPVTIKYLADSFKTEKGWKYTYSTLSSGILNSMEENSFLCNSTTMRKIKIIISNQDNQPLDVGAIVVKGYVHELVARFTEPATYFLTYGSNNAAKPNYDIARFPDKIPAALTTLDLGEELKIKKEQSPGKSPLFKNPAWLWVLMVLIIVLLGWFTLKMLKNR